MKIDRHKTIPVQVGDITIGGDAPIVIQSMTDTDTCDVESTVNQIEKLSDAGAKIVRLTINNLEAASKISEIKKRLIKKNCLTPLVGDFHFNGHILLPKHPECAKILDKYRINPGNIGTKNKHDEHFATIIKIAIKYNKPIRIGVNSGSLDQELLKILIAKNKTHKKPLNNSEIIEKAMIKSAIDSARYAEKLGLSKNKIILSCKTSNVSSLISVYKNLAKKCDYALHLGLTEAGIGTQGIVASSIAIGNLLQQGIGDTIRTSITPNPNDDRTSEVVISKQILQTLGLGGFSPQIISCPGCGRTESNKFRNLTAKIEAHIKKRSPIWKESKNIANLKIAVMGCIVNGPGESKHANIGICLPGRNENQQALVYIDGKKTHTLSENDIDKKFFKILDEYVNGNKG